MHGIRLFEIGRDFGEHAFLRRCRLERQDSFQCLADFVLAYSHRDSGKAVFLLAPQCECELIVKKLLEDQPDLRRTAPAVQQLEAFVLRWEMSVKQGLAARRKPVAFANRGRQRVGNIGIEVVQYRINDSPQHSRTDCTDSFVNWNDPAHFSRIRRRSVRAPYKLDLRVHHF